MPKMKKIVTTAKKTGIKSSIPKKIRKRDGSIVEFNTERIITAVGKAIKASGEKNAENAPTIITDAVMNDIISIQKTNKHYIPVVEEVQDLVERQLILHRYAQAAKAYILYRDRRAELRKLRKPVPEKVRKLAQESSKYFSNTLSEYVFYSTYSKWIPEENRRETWIETIDRYINFMRESLGEKLTEKEYAEIREYMLNMKVLGSMRLLWSAGPAARKTNVTAYNCSFVAPSKWQDFGEIMYILMCGSGLGFAAEHHTVERLPMIERQTEEKLSTYAIKDSREGWADALVHGLKTWASGKDVEFDYSNLRPAGARLKLFRWWR